jgi:ABC-2 type transport system permease protein
MTVASSTFPLRVSQRRVLRSEWTKFRTLRSTTWTLLIGAGLMIGLGGLICVATLGMYADPAAAALGHLNAVSTSLIGVTFAQLAIGVLGVLLISGEYSTGLIRASLTAVPRRLPVLWGKLVVFAGAVFTVSLIGSAISFFVGQAVLSGHQLGVSIGAPGAVRSVIGAALYVTVAGLIGVTLGALFRNTAAGISTFVAAFYIVPPLLELLPTRIAYHVVPYLPSNAGQAIYRNTAGLPHWLGPWAGFGLLCGYAVVLIAAAAWRLVRTDA